jgi:hypothetical protein
MVLVLRDDTDPDEKCLACFSALPTPTSTHGSEVVSRYGHSTVVLFRNEIRHVILN